MAHNAMELMGTPAELFHWVPGEIVVVIRLPRLLTDELQELLVKQARTLLNEFLAQYHISLETYGTDGRWRDNPTMPPVRRRAFTFGLHRKQPLMAIFFHVRHADASVRDALPIALSYLQSHLEQVAQRGLFIVSAMPNWLVMAAPLLHGKGGPAYPARPAPSLDVPAPGNAFPGWHINWQEQGIAHDLRGAEDVLVAVLDTAQHPDRVLHAAARPEWQRNWLLQRIASDMRNEDGSFVIEYDRYPLTNDMSAGQDRFGDARYYMMPDHGLAVAGLIRDVAPHAPIRLIRILNEYGAGDLYQLFAALTDLERELVAGSIRRLVLNVSLTIMPDIRRLPYIWFDQRQWPSSQLTGVMHALRHLEEGVRLLFESLYAQGVLIIAAAGNDSLHAHQEGLPPRPPRAPARYESTVSVTAVNSRFAASNFANAAVQFPSESGVATFGGDAYGQTDGNALPDAVRTLFISPTFPGGEQNLSGWADCSGTSFAAAIISGIGAHLMAQGWSAANVMARLTMGAERKTETLFGPAPDVPHLLANVVRVQQRFGL